MDAPLGNYVNDNPINLGNSVNADKQASLTASSRHGHCYRCSPPVATSITGASTFDIGRDTLDAGAVRTHRNLQRGAQHHRRVSVAPPRGRRHHHG